jgi:ATP/maltotriose-dependent transcriptional regulator MalT
MLVAPAGYGKTTLARQWLAAGERRSAWYVCRRSSADVAALAEGVVMAARSVVPEFGSAILDRLAATDVPAHELDVLAEMMLEEFETWPRDAWLVIDDYHLISESPPAELFLAEIASSPGIRLVVIGRTRPAWATARRVIYGEILDIERDALEMTEAEADLLLGASNRRTTGIRGLESRWPALLGLAALAGGMPRGRPLPSSVYDFLADELFAALSPQAKEAALAIVPMPRMERETAQALLGSRTGAALAEAAAAGIVELSAGGAIEMHPLIREFLLTKQDSTSDGHARQLFHVLLEQKRWDDAFTVVQEFVPSSLEELFRAALPDMLARSHVQTLQTWLEFGNATAVAGPASEYASAELAFRNGSCVEALASARALARGLPDSDELKTHVLILAGRAAQLASLEEEALASYRDAKSLAKSREMRRVALWGEILAAIDLELPEAEQLLADAESECDTLVDVIFQAGRSLTLDYRRGRLRSLDKAYALVSSAHRLRDPLQRCSFFNLLATVLAVAGEYERSLEICEVLVTESKRHRLDFVVAYALGTSAVCYAGGREFDDAFRALEKAVLAGRRQQDTHAILNAEAIRSRIHFSRGEYGDAHDALTTDASSAIPSMAAEVLACRGLALAAVGRLSEAHNDAEAASKLSTAIEPRVLVPGIYAICAAERDPAEAASAVDHLIITALDSRNLDSLVTVYRGVPEVMARASPSCLDDLVRVMKKVGDDPLESAIKALCQSKSAARTVLSPRESEVAQLLAQGYTNIEIGEKLFITPATAKQHVSSILAKLGVRTRTEAALRVAATGARQATWTRHTSGD